MGWLRGVGVFTGITCFGIIIAAVLYEMNSRGIVIDELITGSILITDVMVVVVVLFMLLGGILAVVSK